MCFYTYSSNTDGWRVFGFSPQCWHVHNTQAGLPRPSFIMEDCFQENRCVPSETLLFILFFFMGSSVSAIVADVQQLEWIFACGEVSQLAHRAGLASLARLLLEPPPLSPDHLTSSCEDRQPSFCPVLQTSTAPRVAACYLAALFCV